ncbi:MAG: acetyl-CoA carboxylase biotin carboxylase subunit [Pseudomonadota bacterium]
MSFDSLLVANRGEIACRIIRTAKALGLRSIAVFSEADTEAPHVAMADEAVLIGPSPAGESYLNAEAILAAARQTGAAAIHPGYGFLSENERFAEAVENAGIVFVGPPAKAIYLMGNKAEAKRHMIAAKVPCVPGYEGEDQSDEAFKKAAADIGFPVMVKAAAGGGGRGMRLADKPNDLEAALALARSEAASAFGSEELILEKAIERARHVEIQVFADAHGHVIHLGERDCSVQRRHQKIIEEAPCPVMTPSLRNAMGDAAVSAAKAVDYRGAGTVEFLLDADSNFYFLEMNTRLQVEHPVTEMVTGLDLVALQIAVARGEELPLEQSDVQLNGHAIEARLYAENPARDFLPDTGRVELWRPAEGEGIRIDAGIATGQEITPHYDPMLAKIVAWGDNRMQARQRLLRAIEETVLLGPETNAAFLADILRRETFADGRSTTAFIGDTYPNGFAGSPADNAVLALATALILQADRDAACRRAGYVSANQLGWSSATLPATPVKLTRDGTMHETAARCVGNSWTVLLGADTVTVDMVRQDGPVAEARIDGRTVEAVARVVKGGIYLAVAAGRFFFHRFVPGERDDVSAGGRVLAPMPGLVIQVDAKEGQSVERGDVLMILEAMKMQHQIVAPVSGTISTIAVAKGNQIGSGDLMVDITQEE